jgi:hypothetical protein
MTFKEASSERIVGEVPRSLTIISTMTAAHAFSLSDGTSIPSLAWGTAGKPESILGVPLSTGLLHIDCAQVRALIENPHSWCRADAFRMVSKGYNNEKETGEAIKKSGLKREEIYLTTKRSSKFRSLPCTGPRRTSG